MDDQEKSYITNLKVVLGKIKTELLHTASTRPLRYKISNLIAADWPSRDEDIELIYKLEEEDVLEVINKSQIFFEIKVNKQKFDENILRYLKLHQEVLLAHIPLTKNMI